LKKELPSVGHRIFFREARFERLLVRWPSHAALCAMPRQQLLYFPPSFRIGCRR